jgi:hypothetical protein
LLDGATFVSVYANAYRIHTSSEEVIIDLGFNMPKPQSAGERAQLCFKVTDRVILTYGNAKRLSMSLAQLIKRYEQQFGERRCRGSGAESWHGCFQPRLRSLSSERSRHGLKHPCHGGAFPFHTATR